jgi:hypothetical protein
MHETVSDRFGHARTTLTPTQIAVGLSLVLVTGLVLLFLQDPVVHDTLHHFRHGVGITCM